MFNRKNDLIYDNQINGYREVRSEKGGNVLLGGKSAAVLETEKLSEAFEMDVQAANYSEDGMTLKRAEEVFDAFAQEVRPERVILHLGEAEAESFAEGEFDRAYLSLIEHIRRTLKKCSVCLVTLKNEENSEVIDTVNRHIKNIADAERCSIVDVNRIRENDAELCRTVAFACELGFMGTLRNGPSDQTLVKMIFSMNSKECTETAEETQESKRFVPDPVFRVMGALA